MSQHTCIVLDPMRCINCKACEIQCATWNNLPMPLGQHSGDFPYMENGAMLLPVEFFTCLHCTHPLCLKACELEAMFLTEDNMVLINADKCNGCGDCIEACPTHVPILNPTTGKAVKCDLCTGRLAADISPACVLACPAHALTYSNDQHAHKTIMKSQLQFIKEYGK